MLLGSPRISRTRSLGMPFPKVFQALLRWSIHSLISYSVGLDSQLRMVGRVIIHARNPKYNLTRNIAGMSLNRSLNCFHSRAYSCIATFFNARGPLTINACEASGLIFVGIATSQQLSTKSTNRVPKRRRPVRWEAAESTPGSCYADVQAENSPGEFRKWPSLERAAPPTCRNTMPGQRRSGQDPKMLPKEHPKSARRPSRVGWR
jgi:hypothetical protein